MTTEAKNNEETPGADWLGACLAAFAADLVVLDAYANEEGPKWVENAVRGAFRHPSFQKGHTPERKRKIKNILRVLRDQGITDEAFVKMLTT